MTIDLKHGKERKKGKRKWEQYSRSRRLDWEIWNDIFRDTGGKLVQQDDYP